MTMAVHKPPKTNTCSSIYHDEGFCAMLGHKIECLLSSTMEPVPLWGQFFACPYLLQSCSEVSSVPLPTYIFLKAIM